MEIIVTAFATIVAVGCLFAILKKDIKELRANADTEDETENHS